MSVCLFICGTDLSVIGYQMSVCLFICGTDLSVIGYLMSFCLFICGTDLSVIGYLMNKVQTMYARTLPEPSSSWSVGQPIVAQFSDDGLFYRARVVSDVCDNLVEVSYVDFGNTEVARVDQLRSAPACMHVPIQCYKCRVDGLIPVSVCVSV